MIGKIYQQNLHNWWHGEDSPKWYYDKWYSWWWDFRTAYNSPSSTGEKIINYYRHSGHITSQIWVYIK